MRARGAVLAAVAAMLSALGGSGTRADDGLLYPNWRGQWTAHHAYDFGPNPSWDPGKPQGLAQEAPLSPPYQALLEASVADQAAGGAGLDRDLFCKPPGMPRMMNVYGTMEILVMPDTTYLLLSFLNDVRRIYTDGRDFPDDAEPSFAGYSIGHWIDEDGDGVYDMLEVETRNFNGPRTFDNAGIPLHADNQTILKERIWRERTNPEIMHNEVTTIDHALSRPWTVHKTYALQKKPVWVENICSVGNQHVQIGNEAYFLSAEGMLMPSKKGQPAPDLRYFSGAKK